MRIDGYYWVKDPVFDWQVALLHRGVWYLSIGPDDTYTDKDFDQISSRIKNPDEVGEDDYDMTEYKAEEEFILWQASMDQEDER